MTLGSRVLISRSWIAWKAFRLRVDRDATCGGMAKVGWVRNGNVMGGTQGWGDRDAPLITSIREALWWGETRVAIRMEAGEVGARGARYFVTMI